MTDDDRADLEACRAAGVLLRRGTRSESVRALQAALLACGYPVEVDGVFGAGTDGAVTQYQMAEGLTADGIAGPSTIGHLLADAISLEPANPAEVAASAGTVPHTPARTLIAVAAADLEKREAPDGSNNGPDIAHLCDGYNAQARMQIPGPDRAPWCAKAVTVWLGIALGIGSSGLSMDWSRHPFGWFFGSVILHLVAWARDHGCLITPDQGPPPPGAIYAMVRDGSGSDIATGDAAGHCGIVVRMVDATRFESIDGNVSNRVRRMTRDITDPKMIGWIAWWRALPS